MAIPKGLKVRRLHKAFLRYHDANNWPLLREALRRMGRTDLIGNAKHQLIPSYQPPGTGHKLAGTRSAKGAAFKTQHTGLPHMPKPASAKPRASGKPRLNTKPGSPTGRGKRR